MAIALVLHSIRLVPFAPLVTTLQKIVILLFAAWLLFLSARWASKSAVVASAVWLLLPAALAAVLFLRPKGPSVADILAGEPEGAADVPRATPVTEDELAGLAWLELVTGPLSAEEEREWWDIGGTQHGIFAKRYNIAFAGYAAAAIGMRDGALAESTRQTGLVAARSGRRRDGEHGML